MFYNLNKSIRYIDRLRAIHYPDVVVHSRHQMRTIENKKISLSGNGS